MDADKDKVTVPVLDHGYVRLVETWGSDERIIEAARMSTDKGFQGWGARCGGCGRPLGGDNHWVTCPNGDCEGKPVVSGDEKLLGYLYTHGHMSPFEMAGAVFEIQAPIFVFREWHRHRTQSYNELSARYTPLPDVNYIPTTSRVMTKADANKQAQSVGHAEANDVAASLFINNLARLYEDADRIYRQSLWNGVPKELARLIIPVGRYSRMRASANLRNWIQFLTLRCAPNAQYEIRQYADVVCRLLGTRFPRTMDLYSRYETCVVERSTL